MRRCNNVNKDYKKIGGLGNEDNDMECGLVQKWQTFR